MDLVIVESPTKARTLSRFMGGKYEIMASMGHVRDLPKSTLGVDVEHDFKPEYEISKGKGEIVKNLKKAAKTAKTIYLSMDPDREGEAIAYHVKHLIGGVGKFKRVVFHQITKSAIEAAFDEPRSIDLALVDAQQARRILDRLVGYTLSPVLWKKVRRGLSAGRVQSVAVRLIVEREREIEAFKPIEYWNIGADLLKKGNKDSAFYAGLYSINGTKAEVSNKETADGIVADLEKSLYVVSDVVRKESRRRPFPPFTTSTLQQGAANVLRYTAKRTMSLAQQLYEQGHITYHRTDSVNLAPEAIAAARKLIFSKIGKQYAPDKPRYYKASSKLAQEAHEAIRPTRVEFDAESIEIKSKGERDMRRLYQLIWKRFMASQMEDAIYDQTRVDVEAIPQQSGSSQVARSLRDDSSDAKSVSDESNSIANDQQQKTYLLRANGSIQKFDGWRTLYKKSDEDRELPVVEKDEELDLSKVLAEQKFTEPPPRFTDASLIKALEERGIGRPSTYAPTISTILARMYVEYQDRKFVPTPVGFATNDFLVGNFEKTLDYDFTAKLEGDLDEIALGKKQWVPVIREFWKPFKKKVEDVTENAKRVEVKTEATGEKCPECKDGEQVIRVGKFGKFISCSRFPECKFTKTYVEKLEGVSCPEDGADIVIKRTRRGKQFFGCSNYPKCKWASWRKPTQQTS